MQITRELIESLLYEEEGTALDFKRHQYLLAGASHDDKSELLKDILAFVNAFRRSDGFILIGVEEINGGKSNVVGIDTHLDDAHLQQFVNSKTQRPITFSYREMDIDGVPIGIIHVPQQHRPIYLTKNYGKLAKGTVYLRRGSSTGEATPEEIAQMGADRAMAQTPEPALDVQFLDRESGHLLGHEASAQTLSLTIPKKEDIPDYRSERSHFMVQFATENSNYYRELATFTRTNEFVRPFSLAIRNTGQVSAQDVRLLIEVHDPDRRHLFLEEYEMPDPPESSYPIQALHRHLTNTVPSSDIAVEGVGDTWRIECFFGKVQPQDTVWLRDNLYVGAHESGTLTLNGKLFADNISNPPAIRLDLHFDVHASSVSLDEIEEIERERFLNTRGGKELLAEI